MLRDQPESYRTQWLTAIQLWQDRRMDEAEARFEFAYRLYQRDSQLLAEYGNFLIARGRFDDAVPLLERAYEMHPWILRNTVVLMHGYLGVGRYEDAVRTAHFAREAGGNPVTTLPVLAFASQQLGRMNDAVAAWRVAARYSPGSWRLLAHTARATALAGLDSQALDQLNAARAAAGADSAAGPVLRSIEDAVRSGCYRRALGAAPLPLPPATPLGSGCDALGHWFEYILAAQNAKGLQNAMPPGQAVPRPTSPDST
jgi:tetratricopeptide (TPR) repeat protein